MNLSQPRGARTKGVLTLSVSAHEMTQRPLGPQMEGTDMEGMIGEILFWLTLLVA